VVTVDPSLAPGGAGHVWEARGRSLLRAGTRKTRVAAWVAQEVVVGYREPGTGGQMRMRGRCRPGLLGMGSIWLASLRLMPCW